MAKEIYKSGNYIVTVDADDNSRLFPIGKTVYDEYNSVFRLTEGLIEDDQLIISYADSTNWVDDSAVAYTEATLRTFLRENTGFNPASGGSGAAPIGADLMKTNQTVSYRTGDDGDLEKGRATDFLTLASANPFGTTERFTDELGGQTYTNQIIIDWSTYNGTTVLGYGDSAFSGTTWDVAIDSALSTSIGTYTSGWRLPNINELWSLINMGVSGNKGLEYYPWTELTWAYIVSNLWSSTTTPYASTQALFLKNFTIEIDNKAKTSALNWIPVREFTVTGTVLT